VKKINRNRRSNSTILVWRLICNLRHPKRVVLDVGIKQICVYLLWRSQITSVFSAHHSNVKSARIQGDISCESEYTLIFGICTVLADSIALTHLLTGRETANELTFVVHQRTLCLAVSGGSHNSVDHELLDSSASALCWGGCPDIHVVYTDER